MAEPLDWEGTSRFEVVRCIGRGGMGAVYEARDRESGQRVALKTLLHFDPAGLYLFKQEFRTLAGVHHPNLVRLHEFLAGQSDRVFFSMELVRGVDFLAYVQKAGAVRFADGPSAVTSKQTLAAQSRMAVGAHPTIAESTTDIGFARLKSPADLDRLRPAFRQLVEGVRALHAIDKVHRDIKPSNILVTPEGRVVLLDLGVATEVPRVVDEQLREEGQGQLVGTARYMAPEQAFGEAPTHAADWYSVGVVLYEALVGAPPFGGPIADVIHLKVTLDAPPPSECVDGIPEDLHDLCQALLEREPKRRPTGPQILARLGGARDARTAPVARPTSLLGREGHLRALREAFDLVRGGGTVTVFVSGAAGLGKSVLVQHALDELVENSDAVVLRGRAYERESVPYKAVDSLIDALSRHLMHIYDVQGTLVVPKDIWALARLFPVLRRVPSIGDVAEEPIGDAMSVRRRAFAAARDLFTGLSREHPLVLSVDDVQWGDADSAALLLEVVRPPQAPPMMLVLAHRAEEAKTAPFLTEVRARWPFGAESRDVTVGPLDPEDAQRLALRLLGSSAESARKTAEAIGGESAGSPFLVEELVRSAAGKLSERRAARVTLEKMVGDRLASLAVEARRFVEIVAVGGRPMPVTTVCDAARVQASDDVIALLEREHFVRPGLRDGREVVEATHERIRETIVAQLSADSIKEYHRQLARALQAIPGADAQSIALHLIGAGETERGGVFAERAAEQSAKHLAFDQAARLFCVAIETLPPDSPKVGRLQARLGEVLGWAGRNEDAGRAYIAAADKATGAERVALERAASAQLLAAGRIDEGGLMLRRVLASAGVETPRSPTATAISLLAYKTRLKVFGLRFTERDPRVIPAADVARIDALHVAALGLASVDLVLATYMQARQLVEALRVGDRSRALRAATLYYGSHLATRGGPVEPHEREVHALIVSLVEQGGRIEEIAFTKGTIGVGLFMRGRWREAVEAIDKAYASLPSQYAGMQTQAFIYAAYAHAFLGDLVELRRRMAELLADAELRGDLFLSVLLRVSQPNVLWLAADDPEGARGQITEAKAKWSHGKFLIQDWQVMRSEAEIDLYAGDGAKSYERLRRDAPALKESLLLKVQYMRALTAFARGRAAVASIDSAPERRAPRSAEAARLAHELEREKIAWTAPLAAIVAAAAANAIGDRERARASLENAIALAQAADMSLYAAAARHQLGRHLGGSRGQELVDRAAEAMRIQTVKVPERFATMLVPGRWGA
jgi:serine/threonine protein kinase/tetratricopeptide (TPR) repeat protein